MKPNSTMTFCWCRRIWRKIGFGPHLLIVTLLALIFGSAQTAVAGTDVDDPMSFDKTVIEGEYIKALVPSEQADALRARIRRLDEVFDFMCQEAGWTPQKKLVIDVVDDYDSISDWATSLPRPLVELNLYSDSEGNFLFAGERKFELIAIHEFTHILNMEPNFGLRAFLERVFGRVIPNDPLSLLVMYLSTPPQQSMPTFWLEGAAQWAETKYSPEKSIWGGRGRDASIQMIWRLDAAANNIPKKGDWRSSYIHWPYSSRPYHYGLAYTRYLEGAYSHKASLWDMTLNQARYWPFIFDRGALKTLGKRHDVLINEAMAALEKEEKENIHKLKSVPLTPAERLTPADHLLGAPAWTDDGRLFAASYRPYASRQRYVYVDSKGTMQATGLPAYGMTATRRSPGGALVTSNFKRTISGRYRSRVLIVKPHERTRQIGLRLVQPDLAEGVFQNADALAAVRFTGGGNQELRIYKLIGEELEHISTVPAGGIPWSPAFRPKNDGPVDQIAWVEIDEQNSRLVIAPLFDLKKRRVLIALKGRIMNPVWRHDGKELYYSSDVTGVSNAYRMKVSEKGAAIENHPITHTIGGVVACVPSPDGKELALIDHDEKGPFIARIPNDPRCDPKELPKIDAAWPTPVKFVGTDAKNSRQEALPTNAGPGKSDKKAHSVKATSASTFQVPPKQKKPSELTEYPYHGLSNLEFQYWTPTTMVTQTGGIGVQAAFADPIGDHDIKAGAGVGSVEYEPVGQLYYGYYGFPRLSVMAMGYALESTLSDQVIDVWDNHYDYTETIHGGSASLGFDLSGMEKSLVAVVGGGRHEYQAVEDSVQAYEGESIVTPQPFEGSDNFLKFGLFYNDTTFYPTSYASEDGLYAALTYRHSGRLLGGELDRNRAFGKAGYIYSIFPHLGHQIEVMSAAGWSDGDRWLQGAFTIGGLSFDDFETPRGYLTTEATGRYLGAYSAAYRLPVYRPFKGFGTTPFEIRQIVLDFFWDAALISPDNPFGKGDWYRSAGLEATLDMRFANVPIRPGIQLSQQLDGDKDFSAAIVLRGIF